jgi:hypothetical protein
MPLNILDFKSDGSLLYTCVWISRMMWGVTGYSSHSVDSCIVTGGTHRHIREWCLMYTVLVVMLFVECYFLLKSYELGFRSRMQEGVHNLLLIFETSSVTETMSVLYWIVALWQVHKFCKYLGTLSKFWVAGKWRNIGSVLRTHFSGVRC